MRSCRSTWVGTGSSLFSATVARSSRSRLAIAGLRIRVAAVWRRPWARYATLALSIPLAILIVTLGYYVIFARIIDSRLHRERDRVFPRVLARPLEIRRGQALTEHQLIDRLNDLGYAQRPKVEKPGEFAIGNGAVAIRPRTAELKGQVVRVVFQRPAPAIRPAARRPPPK